MILAHKKLSLHLQHLERILKPVMNASCLQIYTFLHTNIVILRFIYFTPPLCSSLLAPSHHPVDVYLCRDSNSVVLIFMTQTVTPLLCAAAAIKKVQDSSPVWASTELRYDPFVNLMGFFFKASSVNATFSHFLATVGA